MPLNICIVQRGSMGSLAIPLPSSTVILDICLSSFHTHTCPSLFCSAGTGLQAPFFRLSHLLISCLILLIKGPGKQSGGRDTRDLLLTPTERQLLETVRGFHLDYSRTRQPKPIPDPVAEAPLMDLKLTSMVCSAAQLQLWG